MLNYVNQESTLLFDTAPHTILSERLMGVGPMNSGGSSRRAAESLTPILEVKRIQTLARKWKFQLNRDIICYMSKKLWNCNI